MSLLSDLVLEELKERDISLDVLSAFMKWGSRNASTFAAGEKKLLLSEIERMALFFGVSTDFIYNLNKRHSDKEV